MHEATFYATALPPGIYFYRLVAEGNVATRRMLIERLAPGPVEANVVEQQATAAGISKSTLVRAKRELGVQSVWGNRDDGSRCSLWVLPSRAA